MSSNDGPCGAIRKPRCGRDTRRQPRFSAPSKKRGLRRVSRCDRRLPGSTYAFGVATLSCRGAGPDESGPGGLTLRATSQFSGCVIIARMRTKTIALCLLLALPLLAQKKAIQPKEFPAGRPFSPGILAGGTLYIA